MAFISQIPNIGQIIGELIPSSGKSLLYSLIINADHYNKGTFIG